MPSSPEEWTATPSWKVSQTAAAFTQARMPPQKVVSSRITSTAGSKKAAALGHLLFQSGQWDDALAEVGMVHEDLKEPAGAGGELGIAAMISFHRGEVGAARSHLAAAAPHAARLGRLITSL